jgi:hypothetical protein
MNDLINVSDRRLVVITDPHIKKNQFYHVFMNGYLLEQVFDSDNRYRNNIFVKDAFMRIYTGNCWSG